MGVLLPFSRLQESEADRLGLIFMAMFQMIRLILLIRLGFFAGLRVSLVLVQVLEIHGMNHRKLGIGMLLAEGLRGSC